MDPVLLLFAEAGDGYPGYPLGDRRSMYPREVTIATLRDLICCLGFGMFLGPLQ